jgi:predicted dehydrogenase
VNIAYVGLAYSHPFVYRQILERTGHRSVVVWDADPVARAEFAALSGADEVATIEAIPVDAIDGAILTGRLPERIDHAIHFLEQGVPIYTGKPMATTPADLDRLAEAVRRTGTPLLTTSVLRFAPAVDALRRHLAAGSLGQVVAVRAVSAHKIDRYMEEPHVWQDDPARGGGTLLSMGVHALELLAALLGAGFASVACRTDRRFHTGSLSEDVALMTLAWESGLLGSAEVVGGVNVEYYGIEIYGSENVIRAFLPRGDVADFRGAALGDPDPWVEFGYEGTMAAFVDMCQTRRMPVSLAESEAITRTLIAARRSATSGRVEPVNRGERDHA